MVIVEKGMSPRHEGEEALFISFKYNTELVSKVKTIPGRYWHAYMKAWEVPCNRIQKVRDIFGDENLMIAEDVDLEYKFEKGSFQAELKLIKGKKNKEFINAALKEVPGYFKEVAASSSGKYHPDYALGEGGLLRHTKAAVWIADCLFRNYTECPKDIYTERIKDLILISLILHDSFKHGEKMSAHTVKEHPNIAADFVIEFNKERKLVPQAEAKFIASCIRCHMGQWNTGMDKEPIMPIPSSRFQKFVHLCDYLASRKFLEVKFDEEWNVVE